MKPRTAALSGPVHLVGKIVDTAIDGSMVALSIDVGQPTPLQTKIDPTAREGQQLLVTLGGSGPIMDLIPALVGKSARVAVCQTVPAVEGIAPEQVVVGVSPCK